MALAKDIITWEEQGYLCVSVPFTWLLPKARALLLSHPNDKCAVGGPAIRLIPEYLSKYAEIEPFKINPGTALRMFNDEATRTSIGCPNSCPFCLVSKLEGPFKELNEYIPNKIVIDNNFLACSDKHLDNFMNNFSQIIGIDIQGIDPALVTPERATKLKTLDIKWLRMGYDSEDEGDIVYKAIDIFRQVGFQNKTFQVYCLVNYTENPVEVLDRMETLRSNKIQGFAMRYQPPNTLVKNSYVAPQWTDYELKRFCRYWNRQTKLHGVKYSDYSSYSIPPSKHERKIFE